jgi:hypothetical protein
MFRVVARVARRRVYHDEVAPFSDIGADEPAGLLQRGPSLVRTPHVDLHFGF